jgi:hypothetical protein
MDNTHMDNMKSKSKLMEETSLIRGEVGEAKLEKHWE